MDNNESIYVPQCKFARMIADKMGKKSPISEPAMRKYRSTIEGFPRYIKNPLGQSRYLRSEVDAYLLTFPTAQKDANN